MDLQEREPLIDMQNIVKIYEMGGQPFNALGGVSLKVRFGEYVAIMGASGSGKSTLMNLIGCLDRPTSGEYYLEGRDVSSMDKDELATIRNSTIGFVFQQFNLLAQLTALQNVMLPLSYAGVPPNERQMRAKEVLTQVGLGERLYHRPNQLSGGQQQRVSVARALVNSPRLLLADEPTGALDSHTAKEIMKLLDDLIDEGVTVVLVTHDEEVARHARRIVRVRDGHILSDELNRERLTGRNANLPHAQHIPH